MNFPDVDGPQRVTPRLRLLGNLRTHGLTHLVSGFEHFPERHVTEATYCGIADVGAQRTFRIGIFEQERHRIADLHLIPNADSHRRAFLGIDGLAAQVFLTETQVEPMRLPQQVYDEGARTEFSRKKVTAGLVNNSDHFAEKHVDAAGALSDN